LPGEDAHPTSPSANDYSKQNSLPPLPKNYQCKDVCIGQTYPVDMARKKLDAQNLELKKELAYALAPTTMKYSMFNEEGLVVEKPSDPSQEARSKASATHPSQKARKDGPPPGPQLDYDNQPSPIPGLQNRHLNYLKYMGAPVSYLKRLGFVFPRQRLRRW
jgi:hypothetical protein